VESQFCPDDILLGLDKQNHTRSVGKVSYSMSFEIQMGTEASQTETS
jgi:hypothetical protein